MCVGIPFSLFDLALTFALIALILWILAITTVIPIQGGIIHIFLVIAIILFVVWIVFRICNVGGYHNRVVDNGGMGYNNGVGYNNNNNNNGVVGYNTPESVVGSNIPISSRRNGVMV